MSKRSLDAFFSAPSSKKVKSEQDPELPTQYETHASYPIPLPSALPFPLITTDSCRAINDLPDLDMHHRRPFLPAATASQLFDFLRREFCWYRVTYEVRGMTINTPRYTSVFGLDATHCFSKTPDGAVHDAHTGRAPAKRLKCVPRPIPGCLAELQRVVEHACATTFNFCLLNYYRDGSDSISYHSDDESFLGPHPTIASLSLGATRDFHMRLKAQHGVTWRTSLAAGDMLVMAGATQAAWDHAVPKRKGHTMQGQSAGRINITFRKAVVPYGTENYYRYNVHDGPYYRWDPQQRTMILGASASETPREARRETSVPPRSPPPPLKEEQSFNVDEAIKAIDKANESHDDMAADTEHNAALELEAQIRAIDEAVEAANKAQRLQNNT